jgi:hypothetical protein
VLQWANFTPTRARGMVLWFLVTIGCHAANQLLQHACTVAAALSTATFMNALQGFGPRALECVLCRAQHSPR